MADNDPNVIGKHLVDFETWSKDALEILKHFGFDTKPISIQEAKNNFNEVVEYCETKGYGYSEWKGVLIAADHLASALYKDVENVSGRLFIKPDLAYYHSRKSKLLRIEPEKKESEYMITAEKLLMLKDNV